ncbi:YkvA family protein [Paenisporosarcina cavernae]|uniref:DUF1232 domain-containing protein n=1 Tax=Paenisporosarcina cavernae TaxID=2320858 RepID=A0A385YTF2_9BACL|nr:YkvA family protein [Paenisporosarcina cavernae]AYC30109.1 DUF1232 domain-containing protein [Paenisporosarcina cavernae]
MNKLKTWAKKLKRQLYVLYLAYQDDRVPWFAKLVTILVVAYALSPIDLIPDFIPIIGYLDDIILVPLGIVLALKLIPEEVRLDCEEMARNNMNPKTPKNWWAGAMVLLLWVAIGYWLILRYTSFF